MTDPRRPALVAAVYLGSFIAALDVSIVSVALPSIQTALQTDIAGMQWVVGAYTLCLSAFMLSAGPIGDRYGRKRSWLIGVAAFTAGSAICAAAPTLAILIAGCAVQGVAGALLIPGALSILTQAFADPAERARVIGGWSSFTALSLIVGPILGGVLVDSAGWSSIFLINLPIGLLTVCLGYWGIRETAHPAQAALDPVGQGLSVVWLGALTYGLIGAGQQGWHAPATVSALAASVIAFAVFIAVEGRTQRPVLPLNLFRNADFTITNFASFVLGFSGYSSLFFVSLFLQRAQGWSATATGWSMAPQFVTMAAVSLVFGRLAARYDTRVLMMAGYGLIGMAMLAMTLLLPGTPYPFVLMLLAGLGAGMGLAVPATSAAVMMSVPRERSGMASATMNALRQAGMTLGIAFLGTLMSTHAVALLADGLEAAGVPDAGAMAAGAILRHRLPGDAVADAVGFAALLRHATADGFHVAMLCAGLPGAFAAVLLAVVRPRRAGLSR